MKRISEYVLITLAIIILLSVSGVSFAETPLPAALFTDEVTYPVKAVISEPFFNRISYFDGARTDQFNKLIKHLAISVEMNQDTGKTGILIDQNEAFSILQQEDGESIRRIYSFDPSLIYSEKKDLTERNDDDFSIFLEDKLPLTNQYIDCFYRLFSAAPDAFPDRIKTEKTEMAFSGFGKALMRTIISFPADYVKDSFPGALADLADTEEFKKLLSGYVFSGNQKIVLLYNENGEIVRISYDGEVGGSQESLRKVSLVWKCLRGDNHQKDSISIKTPAVAGADKDNASIERDIDFSDEKTGACLIDIQIDHRAGKEDKKLTHFSAQLSYAESLISGSIDYSVKRDGNNARIKIVPELREENNGEYEGTLEIANYSGKIVKEDFAVHLQLQKGDPVAWPDNGMKNIDIDALQAGQKEENAELKQMNPDDIIAGIIVQKMFELPEEDLQYFSSGIPEDIWLELIH